MRTVVIVLVALAIAPLSAQVRSKRPPVAQPFTTPLSQDDMRNKQAVIETSQGTIVIDLLPQSAPNHVGYFLQLAKEGAYAGTTFHRAVKLRIIRGGDPLTKEQAKRALYGTGGLGILKAEISQEPVTAGAVAAVLQPNKPDSAGAEVFIAVSDQGPLDGQCQ